MKKNYRWGIIGAGRIAEKFCTALNFVEGSEVYAVASRDKTKAQDYATKFNAAVCYDNYEDLMRDANVDIIYIATPHPFHYEQAMACIRHNKAVLCEKPMTLNYQDTSNIIAAATEQNVFLMEGLWTASMPFMDKILSIIENDVIGKPQFVSADFGFTAPKDFNGRLFNKALGGGSVLDIGVYPISLATIILGVPTVIKTIAKLSETGVDEYANIILQYPDGETAQLLSTLNINTAVEAEIIGTKGSIKIKNPWFKATDFSVHLSDGMVKDYSFPHACNGFEHEIKEVMTCLDNGLLQSTKVPHNLSLSISKIVDEVLSQAGVTYP